MGFNVTIHNDQTDLPIDEATIAPIVEEVIRFEGYSADEASLNFVDEATICALHEKFFQDPSFTDCISFPMRQEDTEYKILGEIFVCPLAAVTYAESSGADPYEEVLLYIVHGLLHIMGYDDIREKESQEMRSAEKRHIENLKRLNLSVKAPQHDVI